MGFDDTIIKGFKDVLLIKSPSRLTMIVGKYLVDGIVEGVRRAAQEIDFKGLDALIFNAFDF
jgi:hypothetical protein